MNLPDLISACLALKPGEDFALFFIPKREDLPGDEDAWQADIVNETKYVMLGESSGVFSAEGSTPEEAVSNLLEKLRKGKRR